MNVLAGSALLCTVVLEQILVVTAYLDPGRSLLSTCVCCIITHVCISACPFIVIEQR